MGVHDNADSKYSLMGSGSSFSKFTAKKSNNPIVFNNSPNKLIRHEEQKDTPREHTGSQQFDFSDKISLQQQRKQLPVYRHSKKLLEEIRRNNTLIIIGETGSGKTTQIPQLLLSAGMAGSSSCIGITQPRRVAAVSVARRVAQEQNVPPGKLVGYCVRFEDVTSSQTRIKYMTDGMMVREAMNDETLSDYSIIILDEAHERSVQTDVLLGVVRRSQKLRNHKGLPRLKVIIMSATMDVDKFTKYFQAQAVYLEGRQHAVKIYHTKQSQEDYNFSALVTAFQIHRESPANEDILLFLTGQEEIESAAIVARQVAKQIDGKGYPQLKVFPLYSALPTHQQLETFKPSPPGMRKLVLATNIAETSVTIGGIRSVIDTGVVKERTHHPTTGLDVLRIEKVSKAQAWQRTGRAGREASGKCYRTYTLDEFEKLKEMPVPEIQRCCLVGIALQLLTIGIDITTFDFMDKPSDDAIDNAMSCLEKLGAVKGKQSPQLTTLGRTMSLFPLDPRFTKVILASVDYKCLEEALIVIALLSGENIFLDPSAKRQQVVTNRSRFSSEQGDHITLLNVFRSYMNVVQKKSWCQENFINYRNIEYAVNVKKQLTALTERAKLEKSTCQNNTENLRKAMLEGLCENLAELQRDQSYVTISSKYPVVIHPSSVLHGTKPQLVLFTEVILTTKCFIRGLSIIDPTWLQKKDGTFVKNK